MEPRRNNRQKYCNRYIRTPDGSVELKLSDTESAFIDKADFDVVFSRHWSARPCPKTTYAQAWEPIEGRYTTLPLHRYLLAAPAGLFVDHIDGNGLNNRRSNLRLATASQNQSNSQPKSGRRFKGVYTSAGRGDKFIATLKFRNKITFLGTFEKEEDGARAYDRKAIEIFGEFAKTNFPREEYA